MQLKVLAYAITITATLCATTIAQQAHAYPTKPIRMVVPFPAGGGTDLVSRAVGTKLSQLLGQTVVIDNRGGANANIGADIVAKSPADGYTVLVGTANLTVNVSLYKSLSYNLERDLIPITLLAAAPLVLTIHSSVSASSVKEFINAARDNPGRLHFGSTGTGSPPHLAGEIFNDMAKVKLVHVPFKGAGPAVTSLLGGHVQLMFGSMPAVQPHLKSGKLKALAVSTTKRSSVAPELPTIAESGLPGFEVVTWYGLFLPTGTSKAIVDRLYTETKKSLNDPEIDSVLKKQGFEIGGNSPAEFTIMIKNEIKNFSKVIRESNIRLD